MLDNYSSMKDHNIEAPAEPINARIARRVAGLRAAAGLSLEALATRCDVSRSMISLIERGEASATAFVLEKLASGLGVPRASLFDAPRAEPGPLVRAGMSEARYDAGRGAMGRVSNCELRPGRRSENSLLSSAWRKARWTMPILASRLSIIETKTASGVAA